jgi:DNA-binding response OmpR family regulator
MPEETSSHLTERPTIFLVEEDDDIRPGLTNHLRQLGYRLLVAADLEDALEWAAGERVIHADLVLVNLVGRTPEESVVIGRGLRKHAGHDAMTPLVVMPETISKELEGRDGNVGGNDWVCYYDDDANQLGALLSRLLAWPPARRGGDY